VSEEDEGGQSGQGVVLRQLGISDPQEPDHIILFHLRTSKSLLATALVYIVCERDGKTGRGEG
jgi:hypothetical protein